MYEAKFRVAVSRFINANVGYLLFGRRAFFSYGEMAEYLGVRNATVSSWVNKKSSISAFTFFRICLAFAEKRKVAEAAVIREFLDEFYSKV